MKLLLQDFSGHPCQVHLARLLAASNDVSYVFCEDYVTGQGRTQREPEDPAQLTFTGLSTGGDFDKYNPVRRIRQELSYAARLIKAVRAQRFDLVVLSNTPLISLTVVVAVLRLRRTEYVFWQQDVYSAAIRAEADKRGGLFGRAGRLAGWLEGWVARGARSVIPISTRFVPVLTGWGVPRERVFVIPNWAPLDELPLVSRPTVWQQVRGLTEGPLVVYAGTVGLKHSLDALLNVAEALRQVDAEGSLVVVTSVEAGGHITEAARVRGLSNVVVQPFAPYAELPDVLGSAHALLVVLEADASTYSVPSKVLAYLCAGRPVLGLMPADNDAAQTLRDSGAGVVVSGEVHDLVPALRRLLDDDVMGKAGRRFAEEQFAADGVLKQFQQALGLTDA